MKENVLVALQRLREYEVSVSLSGIEEFIRLGGFVAQERLPYFSEPIERIEVVQSAVMQF